MGLVCCSGVGDLGHGFQIDACAKGDDRVADGKDDTGRWVDDHLPVGVAYRKDGDANVFAEVCFADGDAYE